MAVGESLSATLEMLKNELRYNFADCAQLNRKKKRYRYNLHAQREREGEGGEGQGERQQQSGEQPKIYSTLEAAKPKFIKFHQASGKRVAGSGSGWDAVQARLDLGSIFTMRTSGASKIEAAKDGANIYRIELLKICK